MSEDIIFYLKQYAQIASDDGYITLRDTMLLAVKEIEKLRDEINTHNDKLSREKLILDSLND